LLIAGIDTTWSAIVLAVASGEDTRGSRSSDRGAAADAGSAVEGRCRAYSPVTMPAKVMKETRHQRLSRQARQYGAAVVSRRQPRSRHVPDADRVVIDRKENRHAAFRPGYFFHRCVWLQLARMEMTLRSRNG